MSDTFEFPVNVRYLEVDQQGVVFNMFTLDFQVRRAGEGVVDGRIVYVVVATDGSGKRPIPDLLRAALGDQAPLRP